MAHAASRGRPWGGFAQAVEASALFAVFGELHRGPYARPTGVWLRIDGRKAVLTEAGEVLLRRSRQLVENASVNWKTWPTIWNKGWRPKCAQVDAHPNARSVRALTAFMPQSRGERGACVKRCCRASKPLMEGTGPGDQQPVHSGYLGTEMSDVEFIAVAHPEHSLHRMNRELSFPGPGKPDAGGDPRFRSPAAARCGPAWRRAALDRRQPGHRRRLCRQRPGLCLAASAHDRTRTRRRCSSSYP